MIIRRIHIRRWEAIFLCSFDKADEPEVMDALYWADAPGSILSRVSENISAGRPNEGFCYSNIDLRRTVLGIGKTTTGPEYLDTAVHEIVHIVQAIAQADGIDPFSEDFAYLAGDISHEISDIVCEKSCPRCGCE